MLQQISRNYKLIVRTNLSLKGTLPSVLYGLSYKTFSILDIISLHDVISLSHCSSSRLQEKVAVTFSWPGTSPQVQTALSFSPLNHLSSRCGLRTFRQNFPAKKSFEKGSDTPKIRSTAGGNTSAAISNKSLYAGLNIPELTRRKLSVPFRQINTSSTRSALAIQPFGRVSVQNSVSNRAIMLRYLFYGIRPSCNWPVSLNFIAATVLRLSPSLLMIQHGQRQF